MRSFLLYMLYCTSLCFGQYIGGPGRGDASASISNSPLPVELVSFQAIRQGNGVLLTWSTATELNNFGFQIQKRIVEGTSQNWSPIGFTKGGGNSSAPRDYFFLDTFSESGTFAYRLKQIDMDGSFSYSSEAIISAGNAPVNFLLEQNYPNPFNPSTVIKVHLPAASLLTLEVFTISGEIVQELARGEYLPGVYQFTFDAGKLSNGVYISKLKYSSGGVSGVQYSKMILLR